MSSETKRGCVGVGGTPLHPHLLNHAGSPMLYLFALTLATFGIGTGEYVIMGLLPEIASELRVSIPRAGILVSAYAMGVVIGAPLLTVATARVPRKPTLLGLMGLFILGNAACALASDYHVLLVARVATALCHGTFFGIASVVAAELAPPSGRARAIAVVFMGVTLANMLGVPLGTALGQALGWRSTFWAVGGIGCAAIIALVFGLPRTIPMSATGMGQELRALKGGRILTGFLLSILTSASLFCVFTYITPLLREVTHVSPHAVTIILLIFGAGLTLGSVVGGKLGSGNLIGSLLVLMVLASITLAALHFSIPYLVAGVATLFAWSVCAFAINPMLQILVVNLGGEAPDLASTFNQSAFNLGNALGAWIGSFLLARGAGLRELPFAGMGVMLLAFLITLALDARGRSGIRRPTSRGKNRNEAGDGPRPTA